MRGAIRHRMWIITDLSGAQKLYSSLSGRVSEGKREEDASDRAPVAWARRLFGVSDVGAAVWQISSEHGISLYGIRRVAIACLTL